MKAPEPYPRWSPGCHVPRGGLTHQGRLLSRHCPHPIIPTEQPLSRALVLEEMEGGFPGRDQKFA